MNKRLIQELFLASSLFSTFEYEGNLINDEKVLDCIMDMYFYMLIMNDNDENTKDKYFNKFDQSFRSLNMEQQDIVRHEYMDIIEAQQKNKEKIKKKGMNKYE